MIERFVELVKKSPIATEQFINHCIGVYEILKNDNESEEICKSGLYHSIYGTSYFNVTVQTVHTDREIIKNEIGEYAESLVYEMCILPDRDNSILRGEINLDYQKLFDIVKVCRANILDISKNESLYNNLLFTLDKYNILFSYLSRGFNPFDEKNPIDGKIEVFDNMVSYSQLKELYYKVKQSDYKPNHISDALGKYSIQTTRFVSHLNRIQFFEFGLFPYVQKVAKFFNQDIFVIKSYIGCYDKSTCSDSHNDTIDPNTITILIYPNMFWEDIWAGDIKFYDEKSNLNKTIDFKPGRILAFDSRLKHKVMPISSLAQTFRFSISIKCCFFSGLSTEISEIIHVPCS